MSAPGGGSTSGGHSLGALAELGECAKPRPFLRRGAGTGGARDAARVPPPMEVGTRRDTYTSGPCRRLGAAVRRGRRRVLGRLLIAPSLWRFKASGSGFFDCAWCQVWRIAD